MDMQRLGNLFFSKFTSSHVILYVGSGISDAELKEVIAECPWSAVVTTRTDRAFGSFFAADSREVEDCYSIDGLLSRQLSRKKMPIFRLCGIKSDSMENAQSDDFDDWIIGDDYEDAREIVKRVFFLLDYVNSMVFVGIDSKEDIKMISQRFFVNSIQKAPNGSLSFWGMPSDEEIERRALDGSSFFHNIQKLSQRNSFDFSSVALADVIRARSADREDYNGEAEPDDKSDIYFQDGEAVSISHKELLAFKSFGELLTERTVKRIQPLGGIQSKRWFATFLENSSSFGPQWYGYFPRSQFYVKRSYEDKLYDVVKAMLSGKKKAAVQRIWPNPESSDVAKELLANPDENCAIVLHGDPGSSKSVTLGALAYRIYSEQTSPVVFISKETFLSSNYADELESLAAALHSLESKTKVLIIWDSSAYRSGIDRVKKLLGRLQNMGLRFVLVCSSYKVGEQELRGCLPIEAARTVDSRELHEFRTSVQNYSGLDKERITLLMKRLAEEGRSEIFDYYYELISLLRSKLAGGLKNEHKKVFEDVEEEHRKKNSGAAADSAAQTPLTAMQLAFKKAGIDFIGGDADEAKAGGDASDRVIERLKSFDTRLAMFSRFKLDIPYGVAISFLEGTSNDNWMSNNVQQLYKIITTRLPWIHYGENASGDYTFRFRNPLEAELHIENAGIDGERQVEILCDIIDIYARDFRKTGYKNQCFTENLQALLRLMGPNSTYAFRNAAEHQSVCDKLDVIVNKLYDEIIDGGIPDEDGGFVAIIVTFIREFYDLQRKKNIDLTLDDYENRMEWLLDAIDLAKRCTENIESNLVSQSYDRAYKAFLMAQCRSLAVETALCSIALDSLQQNYIQRCSEEGEKPKDELVSQIFRYREIHTLLWPVIQADPTNGYTYNTLFKAYERMYDKASSEREKLQYLGEVLQLVDTCRDLGHRIVNRGRADYDELSDHMMKIKDFSDECSISLQKIREYKAGKGGWSDKEMALFDLYDEMLRDNSASGLIFVCQKELAGIATDRDLNPDDLKRCREVHSFMTEQDNFDCISTNSYALATLIRVTWMLYNKKPLASMVECQLTRLTLEQWKEISRYCDIYTRAAGDNVQPIFVLISALATLHIGGLSADSYHRAMDKLHLLREDRFNQLRMRTPFMICDETGEPCKFFGTVEYLDERYSGRIVLDKVPEYLDNKPGIRFHRANLGGVKPPALHQPMSGLELGIGYTSFSVYTADGRKQKENRT